MLFLEGWFWGFAAVAVPVYLLCPSALKLYWLLLACVVFHYHFAGPAGMAPIIILGILVYGAALVQWRLGRWSAAGAVILLVVGALIFYKYGGFVRENAMAMAVAVGVAAPAWVRAWKSPAAPLGISFFAFEFIHYLYEVRVHGHAAIRNPFHFAVFAIFFPTLAAGPIKRFPDFVPQLAALRNPSAAQWWAGVRRIIRGLFKKICISELCVEYITVFEKIPHRSAPVVIALAVLQGWRIYFDFAGYSDMAIGLAQTLNLSVPENFNRPYWSTSLQEFWRRWHMSLSSWIRDYIYIPLGGNRARRGFNLLTAMVLCGLWHGAAWNFAAWGVYHGLGLAMETGVRRWNPMLFADRWPHRLAGWAICYPFVTYGWLLFFYPLEMVARPDRPPRPGLGVVARRRHRAALRAHAAGRAGDVGHQGAVHLRGVLIGHAVEPPPPRAGRKRPSARG
jgi:alginate O-acetyltransferase complex protein AlgI